MSSTPRDKRDTSVPNKHHVQRTGHWLPQDHRHHQAWLKATISSASSNSNPLHPVILEFQALIEQSPRLYLLFTTMFEQIPDKHPYSLDPEGDQQCRDWKHMLELVNHVIGHAPAWTDVGNEVSLVGVPINAILDWPMGTRSGFVVFQDPEVNAMWKKVLNVWGDYLKSGDSASVLGQDKNGWFGKVGKDSLEEVANLGKKPGDKGFKTFEEMFICDEKANHHGFKSWDDFFTRHFHEGIRPIAEPENENVIANACESKTYKVATNVGAREKFWVKGQPYSVLDMLAHDELAQQFVGGTVYQAFLSALSYHRWHSPIDGVVKKTFVVDGTYFSEPLYEDFRPDPQGESTSQEYISATATRGIIYIESPNPKIGLMAFIGVGMTEVSTCDITVREGQTIKKGDELGMFHFGGSTHCLLFRKGVELKGWPEVGAEWNVPVRSRLCEVV